MINFGTIIGSRYGVHAGTVIPCQLTNGAVNDTQARIVGGVSTESAATITNFGTIVGSQVSGYVGISVGDGFEGRGAGPAMVTNGSAADTPARIDGMVTFVYGSLVNYGTISLAAGKMFYAAVSGGGGGVTNLGTIGAGVADKNTGVSLDGGGMLTNGSANDRQALVFGYVGVRADGVATVTNFGTIEGMGGDAVEFGWAGATLVVEAGSRFIGKVVDDAGGGVLVLANGAGTIGNTAGGGWAVSGDMPAATFTGFGTLDIEGGASFAVAHGLTVAAGGALDLVGTLAGPGVLSLAGGVADLTPGARLTVAKVVVLGGTTDLGAARLVYAGEWVQDSGVLDVALGGTMVFTGAADTVSGTLAGAGLVDFAAGADTLAHVTIGGKTEITGSALATLSGATTLLAGGVLYAEGSILRVTTATLTGGGRLYLAPASAIEGTSAASKLVDQSDVIYGAGALGGGQLTLVNDAGGTIDASLAAALTIDTGANTIVNAGLIEATGAGGLVIASAIDNTGTLLASHGNLTVDGDVSGAGVVRIGAATADFAAAFSENVSFLGAGVLALAQSQAFHGTIAHFSRTGATSLDLEDIVFGAATKVSFSGTASSGVLTVTDGTHTALITLAGNYRTATFAISSDGHGGVSVTGATPQAPPSAPAFAAAMAALGAPAAIAAGVWDHARALEGALVVPRHAS